ncbi:Transcriptional regulator, TetR family [Pseudonocardia sp. Ae168_Ps1]|uniref:TetR/AcrR family transcriptional regulator n=1 Tax=unclassified Pseudonocardia TaxID=2619320 RepID=UPI0001FFE478|nr:MULTISPECIES: TetR family transcriptional regulator [unclassified Pseudonocardia]OLL75819.1 Transcriptional regulator, TetR family [Pseudonocardia sp. Ae150A_Ps1]OLL81818.1 Transcriptional regulator, TetR family [Pseudonocardia sp. Ae168_Ps1]OLL84071.1 Transcriptional regulator, TetR family [Pseudonocardia sp. Ae263_Ps1]OLL95911.1 Transcriptional regulator, TetR family [Pseudonocardia sp. Ae356_Ps1]
MERDVKPDARVRRREERRAEMVDAAVGAIREHGPGVSVAQIAAAAGITKPVLYRHFADRADLQRAVGEHAAEMLMERISPVLAIDAEPIEHVAAVIDAFLGMIEDEPHLYRFVVSNPAEPTAGAEVAEDVRGRIGAVLTTLFGERLRAEGRDSGGAEVWAHGLIGMVQSAGDWWLDRRTMSREALTNYLSAIIWGGIAGVSGIDSPTANADILRLVPDPHTPTGTDTGSTP